MKVKLLGKQYLNFETDKGDRVEGVKLHVCSVSPESTNVMQGCRVATVFTRLDVSAFPLNSVIDLVYEQTLGSKASRLVAIEPVKA